MNTKNIALIGCGNMGQALLRGWLSASINSTYTVFDPYGLPDEFKGHDRVHHTTAPTDIPVFDLIVFAVKPQIMDDVCKSWQPYLQRETAVLSIAAGKTISYFEHYFGTDHPIVRAMPNTPAAIGAGITVAVHNKMPNETQLSLSDTLLGVTGTCEWIEDETLMNAVTAISGSGPAYIFHVVEALEQTAVNVGLPLDLSKKLAWYTVTGSAALLQHDPKISPAQRRINVTSPQGTTEAGLKILMAELTDVLTRTAEAAKKRGEELNG